MDLADDGSMEHLSETFEVGCGFVVSTRKSASGINRLLLKAGYSFSEEVEAGPRVSALPVRAAWTTVDSAVIWFGSGEVRDSWWMVDRRRTESLGAHLLHNFNPMLPDC